MALSKEEASGLRDEAKKEGNAPIGIKPKGSKKIIIISAFTVVFVLIVGGIALSYINLKKPAALDDFAKCLTEKNTVMYGASWCKYTQAQKRMFGNSMKLIDYRDFTEDSNVKITPTWLINGAYYQNVQTFDRLSALTGCSLPQ